MPNFRALYWIPAILAFEKGAIEDKTIGAIPKRELRMFIMDAFGLD